MRLLSSLVFAAALVLPGLAHAQSHWIAPGKIDTFPLCISESCLRHAWPVASIVVTMNGLERAWSLLDVVCRHTRSGNDVLMAQGTGYQRIMLTTQLYAPAFDGCTVSIENWDDVSQHYTLGIAALPEDLGVQLFPGRKTTRNRPSTRGPDADDEPDPPSNVNDPDPRFDDTFWRQLVYNAHDEPGPMGLRRARTLTKPMGVYIKTTDETGQPALSAELVSEAAALLQQWGEQWTGRRIVSRISSGPDHPGERQGWIVVEPHRTVTNLPGAKPNTCGWAWVGANPGRILMGLDDNCMRPRGQFLAMLAHELGHAVGFRHVDPQRYPTSIMKPSLGADFIYPSGKEQFHGDLAYDIGRGKGYCGWPHGDNCPRRGGLSLDPPWMGPPPIAID